MSLYKNNIIIDNFTIASGLITEMLIFVCSIYHIIITSIMNYSFLVIQSKYDYHRVIFGYGIITAFNYIIPI